MGDTESFAQGYTVVNDTQYAAGLFLLDKLGVTPGMHVLDVGCGPGDLTAHIAATVGPSGSVVGIDPSRERIALALRALSSSLHPTPNLTFHEGRAEDLSRFPAASFDAVYVNSTFHWVADQPAAVAEFARVLRPGGRLGVSGQSGDFVADHERIKAAVLARAPYRDYLDTGNGGGGGGNGPRFVTPAEMARLLDGAGFARREFVVNKIVKSAPDGAAMVDWLDASSSGKTYGGIPLDMRPRARAEMLEEWAKITTADGIRMEIDLLVTVAHKA